ncbi:hypothetical protein [Actinotalea sp. K2]|uniref:hypothetical protein n=1 Tax=Actinotalea sp. K2 TaxID=2939438 RepID=UPI002016E669|nr:hypothetical protein [Actinotalea sp. K2]MCL3861731.1 hypothetical protein [Actinotalea sp. K2]
MNPWGQGRAVIDQMLASGQLERVPPHRDAADALLDKARTHLQSAATLAATDVELAYDAMHAANRKGLTAILLVQGMRPTRDAGHTGVFDAARAQLHPPLGPTLAPYTRIRRARNAGDYLDELPATADDVAADLPLCQAIVDMAAKVVDQMPPY